MRSLLVSLAILCLPAFTIAQDGLHVKQGKTAIEIFAGAKLVTTFHHAGYAKPIFYPMNAPNGVPVTRAWPMEKGAKNETIDHVHQKSAWFTHGDVIAEGMKATKPNKSVEGTDFWAELPPAGCGKIVCVDVSIKKQDKDHIVIVTKNEWISSDGKKILDETRTIHVHQLVGAWLIVCDSDLFASVTTIIFGDTKEGSFGVRVNDQIAGKKGKGKIENAEGKIGEKACWGHPSAWCDYSGPIDGKGAGIAVFADPKNPHPVCWHVREYGLMAANPFGREKSGFPSMKGRKDLVTMAKGSHLEYRFGILLHDGDASVGRVGAHFDRFVNLREKK